MEKSEALNAHLSRICICSTICVILILSSSGSPSNSLGSIVAKFTIR